MLPEDADLDPACDPEFLPLRDIFSVSMLTSTRWPKISTHLGRSRLSL